jgi:hypothetical protein
MGDCMLMIQLWWFGLRRGASWDRRALILDLRVPLKQRRWKLELHSREPTHSDCHYRVAGCRYRVSGARFEHLKFCSLTLSPMAIQVTTNEATNRVIASVVEYG